MDIIISNSSGLPIYEQIENQIKAMIISGKLTQGEALPSMRLLAKDLRISVITTKRAYEELERDGFIETVMGRGSFVAKANTAKEKKRCRQEMRGIIVKAVSVAKRGAISFDEIVTCVKEVYEEEE